MGIKDEIIEGLGDRLRAARTQREMSQHDLAEAAGFTGNVTIMRIEKGITKNPKIEEIARIADKLEVSLDWLCTGRQSPTGAVVPKVGEYESLTRFLAANQHLAEDEVEHLRSHRLKRGDPGEAYWYRSLVNYQQEERERDKREAAERAAAEQPSRVLTDDIEEHPDYGKLSERPSKPSKPRNGKHSRPPDGQKSKRPPKR